jgi:arylsulfatase
LTESDPQPAGHPSRRWGRWDSLACGAAVAAFAASRWLWIARAPLSSQYWEEGYRWLALEEILAGAPLPLLDFQADHYQGGSLVMIALARALASLGVAPFVALKAVAVGFGSATCAALFVLGRLFFGRAAGVLSALIYLLGPPLVAYWGVVAMGFHAESALFSVIGVGWLLALAKRTERSPFHWLAFGAFSGLGIWFTPTAAIGVLACVLAWPLLAARPRAAELAAAALGLCLGLAPWLLYNVTHDFAGSTRLLEVFGLAGSADPWRNQGLLERARDLFLRAPSEGLLDPGGDLANAAWLRVLVCGVWLPAGLALLAAGRRMFATLRAGPRRAAFEARSELVFGVYALLFVGFYLGSRFTLAVDPSPIAYRLIVPLAVLGIPPIAISAARGVGARAARRGFAVAACAVGLLSLATATLGFAFRHQAAGTPLSLERADVAFGHILQRKYGNDLEAAVAKLGWLPGERRERVLVGIGWGLQAAYEQVGQIADLARALERIEPDARAQVERGIRFWSNERRARLEPLVLRSADPDSRRALARLDQLDGWVQRPPLVLITLDTTRVDHLSCYGYERNTTPQLDAFAERAVRFERAWSTSSWTLPAHASLFTGNYPSRHGADYDSRGTAVLGEVIALPVARHVRAGKLADDSTTLAELLAARGYRTGAFVAGPWLHRSFGLLQGFERQDDAVTSFGGRPATEITSAALGWLEATPAEQPYFLFVNYFDAHAPYQPSGRYADFPRAAEPLDYDYAALMRGETHLDDDTRAVLRDRYDAEIRDMDGELGRLLEAVRARPGGERAWIVVTADHGEALGEQGRLGHGYWLSEELTRVPLLVHYPGGRDGGSQRSEPVQLVDVLPLLARELELTLPQPVDGVEPGKRAAVFAELRREATTALRFGAAYDRDLATVLRWPLKLERSDAGRDELLRLSEDTLREQREPLTDAADPLRALLEAHAQRLPQAPVRAPAAVDAETLEALRELGYVE